MPSTARMGREARAKHNDENRIGETVTELFGDEALDAQTALKLEALAALHERKVGALMKSIAAQKEELSKLKAASREHRRSQLIQDLRHQVREQELAVDVLKEVITEGPRGQLTQEAVNELVILRTLGGPKRFRPKTREELQNELLHKPVVKRTIRRREAKPSGAWEPAPSRTPIAEKKECPTPRVLRDTGDLPEGLPSAAHLRELGEASAKAEQAEVAVARADLRVAELSREIEAQRSEKFAAERKLDDLQDDASRAEDLRRRLEETRRQVSDAERDCARASGERDALQLDMEHCRASNDADVHALKADLDAVKEELAAALQQEAELQAQCRLERDRAGSSAHSVKTEASSLKAKLETAEKHLGEEKRKGETLQRLLEKAEADGKAERDALQRDARRARNSEREAARKEVRESEVRTSKEQEKRQAVEGSDAVALAKAELLQQHLDALRDEMRRKDDDVADLRASGDAERLVLQEKCAALELELEKGRHQASEDVQAAERRADALAKEARALQARADRLEELEGQRRSPSSSSSKSPKTDEDDELYHTRAALAAHMRLADAYASQRASPEAPSAEWSLARARRDLEKALAGSRPLGAFYARMLERVAATAATKGGPPPRPEPSQKREQRIHHGRGTHRALVDGALPPDLARLEIRGGDGASSSSGSLDDRFDVDDDHLDYSQSSVSMKSSRTYDPEARA